jgi:hypothetical protein
MIRLIPIKLRKWFPPDDEVATAVAMLCILREDFLLEMQGIIAEKLDQLDKNDAAYRRLYFWRNSLRTLEEAKTMLNRLNSHAEFREALERRSPATKSAFDEVKRQLNIASDKFLYRLRSTVGAHLDQLRLQAAINRFEPLYEGFLQLGETRGNDRYRFSTEILWSAILEMTPADKGAVGKVEEITGGTASLIPVVEAIDDVFRSYVTDRRLGRQ